MVRFPPQKDVYFIAKEQKHFSLFIYIKISDGFFVWFQDSSGNPAGEDLNGNVVISIKNCSGDSNQTIPLFEGKTKRLEISLEEGKAHVDVSNHLHTTTFILDRRHDAHCCFIYSAQRLALMENSPGENGSAYTLLFTPEGPMVPPTLAPFELPFHFYNGMIRG